MAEGSSGLGGGAKKFKGEVRAALPISNMVDGEGGCCCSKTMAGGLGLGTRGTQQEMQDLWHGCLALKCYIL